MSQAQTEAQTEVKTEVEQTTTVPAQQPEKEQPKKSTGYRVEEEKTFEINRSHTNRREKAILMQAISIGLFGRRRYKNMYLVSSLNNFYPAIMIANTLQKKVENLALVIRMDKIKYTEFAEEGAQGVEKQYSTFTIKITREPTEEDKKHPGFNAGLEKIQKPLTEILKGRDQRKGDRRREGKRRPQGKREGREGREERRKDDKPTVEKRKPEKRYEEKNSEPGSRRPERETRGRDNQDRRDNRDNRRDDRDNRRTQERRPERSYEREERRPTQRRDRDEDDFDRRPRKYRENKQERVEEDTYRRGEKKTRGGPRPNEGGRVAEHGYNPAHMSRGEDRKDRAPQRGKRDRYESDDDY